MLGPLVNAAAVVICALAGCFFVRGIAPRFEETLKKGIGLAIIYVGIRGALENRHVLLLIMSMVSGAVIGELINIDRWMNRLGLWAENKLYGGKTEARKDGRDPPHGKSFARGFVSASILFCSGSMAIVGSMQSGLAGNHETLYAKSILDGSLSLVFGASMGIGVAFSAIPVIVYQGGIALLAIAVKDMLTREIITEMSAVGNLLVAAIGFNFVVGGAPNAVPAGGAIREIRVANLIPAIFIPWIYLGPLRALF
ncbi:MAG: DUF554 domain-containing protein [Treponema sp.]|jgi:uncharacterized membrane protein YqgA involved in biofilm formation|nr:DUF554 domain-containing protein [Treponema sp.]